MVSTKDLRDEFANKPAGNADEPSASAAELLASQVGDGFKRVAQGSQRDAPARRGSPESGVALLGPGFSASSGSLEC